LLLLLYPSSTVLTTLSNFKGSFPAYYMQHTFVKRSIYNVSLQLFIFHLIKNTVPKNVP